MEPRMTPKPVFHTRMFVGSIMVHDQLQVQPSRGLSIDFLQETDELMVPMAGHTIADDLAIQHAEGSKQCGGTTAFAIVRLNPTVALLHRQSWLGSVQSLDPTLLIPLQDSPFLE